VPKERSELLTSYIIVRQTEEIMAAEKCSEVEVPDILIQTTVTEQRPKKKKRESFSSGGSGGGSASDSEEGEKEVAENKLKLIPRHTLKQEFYDSVSSNGEEDDGVPLTDELRDKLIEQAEYYFSDENLKRDGFLLKHVKRNKEGFVNLKLLASFKKMRSLSRDYRVIGEALKTSLKLVVNDTGLKIRRVDPLPKELLDQARVKNLIVSNMPNENPSMDYVIAVFPGHKDDVISVRVVKPGKKFPNDLQSHFSRHPDLKSQIVAVVEFDAPENAASAIKDIDTTNYPGIDVKLLELGPKQAKRMGSGGESPAASDTPVESDPVPMSRKAKKKLTNRLLEINANEDSLSSCASSSDSDWSSFSSCSKRYNRSHGSKSPSPPSTSPKTRSPIELLNARNKSPSDILSSPRGNKNMSKDSSPIRKLSPLVVDSPRSSPETQRKYGFNEGDNKRSSWMYQRMQLTKTDSDSTSTQKLLEIIRQPKGPDGSFGFSNHPLKKYVLVHAY